MLVLCFRLSTPALVDSFFSKIPLCATESCVWPRGCSNPTETPSPLWGVSCHPKRLNSSNRKPSRGFTKLWPWVAISAKTSVGQCHLPMPASSLWRNAKLGICRACLFLLPRPRPPLLLSSLKCDHLFIYWLGFVLAILFICCCNVVVWFFILFSFVLYLHVTLNSKYMQPAPSAVSSAIPLPAQAAVHNSDEVRRLHRLQCLGPRLSHFEFSCLFYSSASPGFLSWITAHGVVFE